ncbi:MAG TPA: 3-phosphoshikimate 1-carboxyvinyltransferase [Blastocatellia bacterium]|nr:3-phosphoshikimate 1-carboxyvinyltransferase [Blastocatellia bacterium]
MSRSTGLITITGRGPVGGRLRVPGDKSISHRVAMLASVAAGRSVIEGYASSADCLATLDCLERLGVPVEREGGTITITGRGLRGLDPVGRIASLDAKNSGSTIRMLAGLLAGQRFRSVIDGDDSLRRRPMRRIIEPLGLMGCPIDAEKGMFAPLTITGSRLKAVSYESPVASAQVKSCVLFAGLFAEDPTIFIEPAPSRNHSELMLNEMSASITWRGESGKNIVEIAGGGELKPLNYRVPGDISSAAFFIAAASMVPDSNLTLTGVGLNPTRTAFIDVLKNLGAEISTENERVEHGEAIGDLLVRHNPLAVEDFSIEIRGALIPNLIDELPILAVVATQTEGRFVVRDARELRVKESDRVRTVVEAIRSLGGKIDELEDGFAITGPQRLSGGRVNSRGDHRIAMAFSIAGLVADGVTEIINADAAAVSFPEFYDLLTRVTPEGTLSEE